MKKLSLGVILLITALIFSGCTAANNQEQQVISATESSPTSVTQVTESDQTMEVENNQIFEISMANFSYSESELVVKAGEQITINVTNNQGNHDFVIDELGIHSEHLSEGESQQLTFTVSEEHIGQTYEFYCSVGAHRQLGMVGTITIVE